MINQITSLDPVPLRAQFPALRQAVNGQPAAYLDGPGGTQVPQTVIDAISGALSQGISNDGGSFLTSERSLNIVAAARQAMVDFLGANRPEEIVFGPNMTTLTFSLSRALARTWGAGDEIVVTRNDHDANISPWLMAAADRGVTVRWLDADPADSTLRLDQLPGLLNERTRLVAVTYASNAVGSITDVAQVVQAAHEAGALVFVDAVHFAPHGLIDVTALDCDFLACSPYKFFGPHAGTLYGKYELLQDLAAYKVRPATSQTPGKWETGTPGFEMMAGVTAAVDYIAALGGTAGTRRARLVRALDRIKAYEMALSERFLRGAVTIPGLRVYGITDVERLDERTPTFAVSLDSHDPAAAAAALGDQGIFVWSGHYYAIEVMRQLDLLDKGGLVRIGFVHYNTPAEVDRVLAALAALAT